MSTSQVKVVERQQNISIQEQEIMRKEKELDSKVKKPAEAEKYRLEKIAEAEKQRIVLEAEAESEAKALKGEAEAYAIEVKAKAEAEQVMKIKIIVATNSDHPQNTDNCLNLF